MYNSYIYMIGPVLCVYPWRIHGTGIFTYTFALFYHWKQPNVGKYSMWSSPPFFYISDLFRRTNNVPRNMFFIWVLDMGVISPYSSRGLVKAPLLVGGFQMKHETCWVPHQRIALNKRLRGVTNYIKHFFKKSILACSTSLSSEENAGSLRDPSKYMW